MLILRALAYTHRYFSLKTRETSRSKRTLWLKTFFAKKYLAICEKQLFFCVLWCSATLKPGFLWDHPSLLNYCLGSTQYVPGSVCVLKISIYFFFLFSFFPLWKPRRCCSLHPPQCRSAVMVMAQYAGVRCCDVQAQPACASGALGRKQSAGLWQGLRWSTVLQLQP